MSVNKKNEIDFSKWRIISKSQFPINLSHNEQYIIEAIEPGCWFEVVWDAKMKWFRNLDQSEEAFDGFYNFNIVDVLQIGINED